MIRIAICDDEQKELMNSQKMVAQYFDGVSEEANIELYSDPKKLINTIKDGTVFDLYILDVLMGDINGIDVAKIAKSFNKNSKLFFTTTSREYAVDAFAVHADHYLVKPYSYDELKEAMNRVIKTMPKDLYIIKSTSDGVKKIMLDSFCYSESSGHYQYVHLDNGEVLKIRLKTNELWDELSKYSQFLRPHSGYIVNMDHVKTMSSYGMSICDVDIPISKNTYNKVKHLFMEYTFKKQSWFKLQEYSYL